MPLSRTVRTEGRPSRVAVARAIAVGSGSVARICSNQAANCLKGSVSAAASSSGAPRYSRRILSTCRQADLVALDVHADGAPGSEGAEEQHLGQRLLDDALDQARHRPRTEGAVEAFRGEP